MKLDRSTINGQSGAVAAYLRDGLLIPATGIEGYLLFTSDDPGTSARIVPKLDYPWMPLSLWVSNTNVEGVSYKFDIYRVAPVEASIFSTTITDKIYTFPPLVINSDMQMRVQGINSLKSIILIGKPIDVIDKNTF